MIVRTTLTPHFSSPGVPTCVRPMVGVLARSELSIPPISVAGSFVVVQHRQLRLGGTSGGVPKLLLSPKTTFQR